MNVRSRLAAMASILAIGAAACSTAAPSAPAGAPSTAPSAAGSPSGFPEVLPLTFGTIPGANHLPNNWAINNAAKYGLEITDVYFTSPADNLTALVRGLLDVADQTPSTAITARDRDLPLVMIAGDARGSTQIVISGSLGIAEGDWAGMKAKAEAGVASGAKLKFGASVGPSSNFVECYFQFKEEGIDPATQLEIVNIPAFPDMAAALQRGAVDMLCAPQPYATQAKTSGGGVFFAHPFDTEAGDALGSVSATEDALADPLKREAIRRFVQAMADGMKELEADEEAKIDLAMEVLRTEDRAFAEAAMEGVRFDIGLDEDKVKALARYHFELGHVKKDWSLDTSAWLSDTILNDIER